MRNLIHLSVGKPARLIRGSQRKTTFYKLLKSCSWSRLEKKILELFPEPESNIIGYKKVYKSLLKKAPINSNHTLWITKEQWWGEWETHVFSVAANGDQHYGLEFTPWGKVLGMKVRTSSKDISAYEIVARVLFEITFFGFSEERVSAKLDALCSMAEEHRTRESGDGKIPARARRHEKGTKHPKRRSYTHHLR